MQSKNSFAWRGQYHDDDRKGPKKKSRVIKCKFEIIGKQPDGDTWAVRPYNKSLVSLLDNYDPANTGERPDGTWSGRQKNIDTRETHFMRQSQLGALDDRDAAMKLLGWGPGSIKYGGSSGMEVTSAKPRVIEGYILADGMDVYGRIIAESHVGPLPEGVNDGDEIEVTLDLVRKSVNAELVAIGFAYASLYNSALPAHRALIFELQEEARKKGLGFWTKDATADFEYIGLESVTLGPPLNPKIARRLIECAVNRREFGERDPLSVRALTQAEYFIHWLTEIHPDRNDYVLIGNVKGGWGTMKRLGECFRVSGKDNNRLLWLPDEENIFNVVYMERYKKGK